MSVTVNQSLPDLLKSFFSLQVTHFLLHIFIVAYSFNMMSDAMRKHVH